MSSAAQDRVRRVSEAAGRAIDKLDATRRKTMRRSRQQAETLARSLREHGHTEVKVRRVTATDWEITYVE